nr:CHASE2 domain-containing protein [Desulfobacteraceae bacterium]
MKGFFRINPVTIFGAATLAVLATVFWPPGFAGRLELLVQDLFFTIRGPVAPGNEVVIAAIDEKSIDKLGRWPWPRRTMADLAEKLSAYDAKVFG